MRWPLRYQILLPLAVVLLVSSAGVSGLDAFLAARSTEGHIRTQLRDVARTLYESSFPLTDRVLRQARGLSGAELAVTNREGRVVASSFDAAPALPAPRASASAAGGAPWEDVRLGEVESIAGEPYFHSVVALGDRGGAGQAERLHILYPERYLREARWQATYPPLVVGALTLLVVTLVAVVFAGRLSRPIVRLSEQVVKLARGEYEPAPLPPRDDELRDLVRSVNLLAEQLDEMRRAVIRTERLTLLGRLSGGLAHHLRNNVTGARLAVQLHQRHCRQIDPESLAVALRQLKMTEEHLQRFLAAGRPQPPAPVPCSLEEILDALSPLVEPACRHRHARFEIRRLEDPAALDRAPVEFPATLRADPEQLRQLLLNLTLNAIEAAGPGGWVRVEYSALERSVRVRVVDSGPGPTPEIVERLFEAFATDKPEGVGLGLAVARQIAQAHGGELVYRRDPHTTFELSLPRAAANDQREQPQSLLTLERTSR